MYVIARKTYLRQPVISDIKDTDEVVQTVTHVCQQMLSNSFNLKHWHFTVPSVIL